MKNIPLFLVLILFISCQATKHYRASIVQNKESVLVMDFTGLRMTSTVFKVCEMLELQDINVSLIPTRNCFLAQGMLFLAETTKIDSNSYHIFLCNSIYLENRKPGWEREAIVHEMVHVWQMFHGRVYVDGDYVIWEGKQYSIDMSYGARPWESEAVAMTKTMLRLL